jgi:hypothetical protein
MEGASRVDGRCTGLLRRLGPEHAGYAGESGPVVLAGFVPRQGNPLLETLLPAVSEGCTGLYAAVRGIGGAGGPVYVHMVDSVVVAGIP